MDEKAQSTVKAFQTWFPPAFLGLVALGALGFELTFFFSSHAALVASATALDGSDYAVQQTAAFEKNPLVVHAHALVGIVFLLVAPFQFWKDFRLKNRNVHKIMGYVTMTCLVLLSTSGLAVSIIYAFSGLAGMIPNSIWMAGILACTALAWLRIKKRDMMGHQAWITRAVALTLGVTLGSVYLPILTSLLHVASRTALAISFWLGVFECLVVGELWLRSQVRKPIRVRP